MIKKIIFLSIMFISFTAMHGMEDSKYALHEAANEGDICLVEKLLKQGANVNAIDESGNTPLHKAAKNIKKDMVELLVNNKADINIENGEGKRPIDIVHGYIMSANFYIINFGRNKVYVGDEEDIRYIFCILQKKHENS